MLIWNHEAHLYSFSRIWQLLYLFSFRMYLTPEESGNSSIVASGEWYENRRDPFSCYNSKVNIAMQLSVKCGSIKSAYTLLSLPPSDRWIGIGTNNPRTLVWFLGRNVPQLFNCFILSQPNSARSVIYVWKYWHRFFIWKHKVQVICSFQVSMFTYISIRTSRRRASIHICYKCF